MSTLVEIVRTKSGASVSEASDARIIEALTTHSVELRGGLVSWSKYPNGEPTRKGRVPISKYRCEATGATGSVTPLSLHDASGSSIPELSVTQAGDVSTSAVSGALPAAYASGRVYDVYAAAADIVGDRIAAAASTTYDFKRGDQSFERSQILAGLRALQKELRRLRVPRRRGETRMRDQATGCSSC